MKTDDISNLRRIVSDWRNSRYQINERIAISELLAHIDAQASQIATLKAALRKDRFFRVWANTRSTNVDTVTKIADRQLAKEYPDIDWGGQP
jgi:hypothetical protein